MVESTALEMRHTRKGIEGSNPSLSAIHRISSYPCKPVTRWEGACAALHVVRISVIACEDVDGWMDVVVEKIAI